MSLIATYLEEEIKRELRQRGIVVWLDKDNHYGSLVDRLVDRHIQKQFFAPVIAFRGSYLEMLLELYRAGKRYRKALPTLIREAVTGHKKQSPSKPDRSHCSTPKIMPIAEKLLSPRPVPESALGNWKPLPQFPL